MRKVTKLFITFMTLLETTTSANHKITKKNKKMNETIPNKLITTESI